MSNKKTLDSKKLHVSRREALQLTVTNAAFVFMSASVSGCGTGAKSAVESPAAKTFSSSVESSAATLLANISININADIVRTVGGVNTFSREKFINIHAINSDLEWWGGNAQSLNQPQEITDLLNGFVKPYDVYFGRDSGSMAYQLSLTAEDPSKPGFANASSMTSLATGPKNYGYLTADQKAIASGSEFEKRMKSWVLVAQPTPFFPNGHKIGSQNWNFSVTDTVAEPIGTASGNYIANYLVKYFNQTNTIGSGGGMVKPSFVEAINEPLYNLIDAPAADLSGLPIPTFSDVFRYHTAVRDQVRLLNGAKPVLVGGYTVAFPDFESSEPGNSAFFARWNARDAAWLGGAGKTQDFISLHLYDFEGIPIGGQVHKQYRKGSNVEATFDMLDYAMNWAYGGALKPIVISEFGGRAHTLEGSPWSPQRDWYFLKAMNSLLVQFMQRPDRISKAVPFVPLKAEWGRTSVPYPWRLLRQKFEDGTPANAGNNSWTYTELVKFYQLWAGVSGQRVDTWSSDLDFMADAYVDSATNTMYVLLNSLEPNPRTLDLKMFGLTASNLVTSVEQRHLYPDASGNPVLSISNSSAVPTSIVIGSEATIVLKIKFNAAPSQPQSLTEYRHYATVTSTTTVLKAIQANVANTYTITGVGANANGEATLRLGIGRPITASLMPVVKFNGVTLSVPTDYRGYDQYNGGLGRDRFFGVLEIPVPRTALQASNTVTVTFSDAGGSISSLILQNSVSTRALSRQ